MYWLWNFYKKFEYDYVFENNYNEESLKNILDRFKQMYKQKENGKDLFYHSLLIVI